jgi:hypothetical protein
MGGVFLMSEVPLHRVLSEGCRVQGVGVWGLGVTGLGFGGRG